MLQRKSPPFEQFPQGESTTINGRPAEDMHHRHARDAEGNELPHQFVTVDLSRIEPGDKVILIIGSEPFRLARRPSESTESKGRAEEDWSISCNGKSMGDTALTLMLHENGFSLNNLVVTAGKTAVTYANASERKFQTLRPKRKSGADSISSPGIASDIYVLTAQEVEERKAV
jgi:hypothetical protein